MKLNLIHYHHRYDDYESDYDNDCYLGVAVVVVGVAVVVVVVAVVVPIQ